MIIFSFNRVKNNLHRMFLFNLKTMLWFSILSLITSSVILIAMILIILKYCRIHVTADIIHKCKIMYTLTEERLQKIHIF